MNKLICEKEKRNLIEAHENLKLIMGKMRNKKPIKIKLRIIIGWKNNWRKMRKGKMK